MADKVKRICASENCDRVLRSHCKSAYCKRCREQNVGGVGNKISQAKR